MTLLTLKKHFTEELINSFSINEIHSFFKILTNKVIGLNNTQIITNPEFEINGDIVSKFEIIIAELKNKKPIQYIIGSTEFYGLEFIVDQNVLIPRPETEELVDFILNNENLENKTVIDIGTGSGCIPVSIAKNSKANVFALDISKSALNIAKKNSQDNKTNVSFIEHDILSKNPIAYNSQEITLDIIISNPPYVRNLEKELMDSNVLDYEPHLAVFVPDNEPLLFYEAIANVAIKQLNKNGKIYLEINEFLANETAFIFSNKNFSSVKILKDLSNKNRFLIIEK